MHFLLDVSYTESVAIFVCSAITNRFEFEVFSFVFLDISIIAISECYRVPYSLFFKFALVSG